jgi:hypothetical protein
MTTAANVLEGYKGLGWFLDRHWRGLAFKAIPALDRLLLSSFTANDARSSISAAEPGAWRLPGHSAGSA